MKPCKLLAASCLLMLFVGSSCTVTTHTVTNNPVGDARGDVGGTPFFNTDLDLSYQSAAEKGSIDKIGTARFKAGIFIVPFYQTTVSGQSK